MSIQLGGYERRYFVMGDKNPKKMPKKAKAVEKKTAAAPASQPAPAKKPK